VPRLWAVPAVIGELPELFNLAIGGSHYLTPGFPLPYLEREALLKG
jgi:hypothetical protein